MLNSLEIEEVVVVVVEDLAEEVVAEVVGLAEEDTVGAAGDTGAEVDMVAEDGLEVDVEEVLGESVLLWQNCA